MSKFLLLSFFHIESITYATETSSFAQNRKAIETSSCGDNIEISQGWSGEYPGRVVDVQETTTLDVRTGPCSFGTIACTIKQGLYHPWTQDSISKTAYISVSSKKSYIAKRDIQVYGSRRWITYPKGTSLEYLRYGSEGQCLYRINGLRVAAGCPDKMEQEGTLALVSSKKNPTLGNDVWKQLAVQCEEGHLGWIRVDDTLFQQDPNVLKGSIIGYGKIGPYTPYGIK